MKRPLPVIASEARASRGRSAAGWDKAANAGRPVGCLCARRLAVRASAGRRRFAARRRSNSHALMRQNGISQFNVRGLVKVKSMMLWHALSNNIVQGQRLMSEPAQGAPAEPRALSQIARPASLPRVRAQPRKRPYRCDNSPLPTSSRRAQHRKMDSFTSSQDEDGGDGAVFTPPSRSNSSPPPGLPW